MTDDLRYALRMLIKNPAYAAVAIATLALGIGGTVAMFSAFYAVLLAPLPYRDANEIVVPVSTNAARGFDRASVPYADYVDWRDQRDVFEHVAVWRPVEFDVAGNDTPERVDSAQVSNEFFDVLGVTPILGRTFRPDEHEPNAARAAVISYGLWQRALGGASDVLNRQIRVGGVPVTIIGVLGPRAMWPNDQELWLPLRPALFAEQDLSRRDNMIFLSIARLKPGVALETGRARVKAIAQRVAADHPDARKGWSSDLIPLRDYVVEKELRNALVVLLAAVGVVLLIVCVNVANLLLARGTSRGRELAVRMALGAGRGRLIRQLLTESLVVAAVGGVLGVAVAVGLMRGLAMLAPDGVPFVTKMELSLPALLTAGTLTLMSVVLFGILPAVSGARQKPAESLKEGGAGAGTARGTRRLRDVLVVVEIALAVVLLVSAGLLVRSFGRIVTRSAGVDVDRVVAARVSLSGARYPKDDDRTRFYATLTRELAALPGVTAAAATSFLPAGGGGFGLGRVFLIEGQPEPPSGVDYPANWTVVTPDYFKTLGIPIVTGRAFTDNDVASSTPVVIINETLARRMFPQGNALGQRIRSWRDENILREIVAVVGDVRYSGLADQDRGLVHVPHRQNAWGGLTVAVRASGDPAALAASLRQTINRLDPALGVGKLGTLTEFARASVARERFSATLLAGFAAVAVLLAAVGIYGVMAYVVALRSRELGVRAALGASPRELFALVMQHGLVLTAIGGTIGAAAALAAARAMSGLLFGISAKDPLTFAIALAILPVITLLACAAPGRRAARVDPMVTLRSQ
jgi:putative ABC transport system permease protein